MRAGDIYFVNPATKALAGMIRLYPAPATSAFDFSIFSFSALNGVPDASPFDSTIYPAGVSAAGGLTGMPTVNINESFTAPSGLSDPSATGTYTFTLVGTPEPSSAAMAGIGAAILLRRRAKR